VSVSKDIDPCCSVSGRFERVPPQIDLLYEASCLVVEESVLEGREHTAGRVEAGDVVVGILHAVAGGGQGSGGHDDYLKELRC
jgi:hypothetical protein